MWLSLQSHRVTRTAIWDSWVGSGKGRTRFECRHLGFRSPVLSLPPHLFLVSFSFLALCCFSLRDAYPVLPPHLFALLSSSLLAFPRPRAFSPFIPLAYWPFPDPVAERPHLLAFVDENSRVFTRRPMCAPEAWGGGPPRACLGRVSGMR